MLTTPLEVNGTPVPLENGEPVKVSPDTFNCCTSVWNECSND